MCVGYWLCVIVDVVCYFVCVYVFEFDFLVFYYKVQQYLLFGVEIVYCGGLLGCQVIGVESDVQVFWGIVFIQVWYLVLQVVFQQLYLLYMVEQVVFEIGGMWWCFVYQDWLVDLCFEQFDLL